MATTEETVGAGPATQEPATAPGTTTSQSGAAPEQATGDLVDLPGHVVEERPFPVTVLGDPTRIVDVAH